MAKNKDKKRHYGSATANAEKRSTGASYGYIKIPKNVKMFTPEPDTTALIDILPYEVTDKFHMDKIEVGTMWYKKPFKIHKYVGAGDGESYVCPTTVSKPCPICEHHSELKKDNADDKALAKAKPSYRNIYAIKVREYDGKKKFDKDAIHLFDFSDWLFQEVFENQLKRKKEFDTFFLHDEGCSLEITFDEGSYNGGKFAKVTRIDFVERKKQYKDDILDTVPNLDEVLTIPDYDELEAVFFGEAGVDSDEDEPKDSKKDKKKKDKSKDEAPDEQEEKKSKKDKKKNKKKAESEPEEDEDEEDEKPVKKDKKKDKKKKKSKDECPYNHKFGKDTDKFDDCSECDVWNECKAAKKAAKKNK